MQGPASKLVGDLQFISGRGEEIFRIASPSLIYRLDLYLARKEFRSITKCRRPR